MKTITKLRDSPSRPWWCHSCVKELYLWQMDYLQRRVFYSFLHLSVRSHILEFLTSEHSGSLYEKKSGKSWHSICKIEKFDLVCQGSVLHCNCFNHLNLVCRPFPTTYINGLPSMGFEPGAYSRLVVSPEPNLGSALFHFNVNGSSIHPKWLCWHAHFKYCGLHTLLST